ncbi:cytochrome C [Rhizobium johnstonii]|uniref:c-type cytochrome n=1 Tax=Rhizobium johnstonii TaxID=3019933 RepID=UPI003F997851
MWIRRILRGALVVTALAGGGLYVAKRYLDSDHTDVALLPPDGPPRVQPTPDDWSIERAKRIAAKQAYMEQNQIAFDWFADFPFSQTDGTALIILRLLPLLAPEQWEGGDKLLSEVGLFMDTRSGQTFLPRGVGFSGLDPAAPADRIDMTSFTCGACHIGRVADAIGGTIYIDGAVNGSFNIVKYYTETARTIRKFYGGKTDRDEQIDELTTAILAALDKAVATSPTYFYQNWAHRGRAYNAGYEAHQVALFRADARRYVKRFADYTEGFVGAFGDYLDKTYPGYQQQMMAGLPGMADATGVSATHGYEGLKTRVGAWLGAVILPDHPGITDFMPVWEQNTRAVEWDSGKKQLVNGGGQYNGNIPIPVFRNLAASTTMGLNDPDIRVPAFAAQLLGGLPATPYPFDIDVEKATRGESLFTENCAGCHQPRNGAVYDELGTDPSRSRVVNTALMLSGRQMYASFCPPDLALDLAGSKVKPCAEYEGVSLENFGTAIMRPLVNQLGYNATALRGIWASAPYLHNGSVPTMRQLLIPRERPDRFVRGRLDYDKEGMGFFWQEPASDGEVTFDTTAFTAVNHRGHDRDIESGGKRYRLDWTDDPQGADDLIEYLKTL